MRLKLTQPKLKCFFLITLIMLNGCAVGPQYKRPLSPVPKAYTSKALGSQTISTPAPLGKKQSFKPGEDIPAEWWALFHSKPLNQLVIASFKHNPSVGSARASLHAALETVYAQRGAFLPFVGASFTASPQKTAGVLQSLLANNKYDFSLYTGQLFVSYTLDVFGGVRRQFESLVAQAEFQQLQLEATYLTISTNVVNAAIQEAALREQIQVTKQIIASQAHIVTIYQRRQKLGDSAIADIATQESTLAATQATLPPLEKQLTIQRDLINALTGRLPDDAATPIFKLNTLQLPSTLPLSLPSTLLEHRPDIRAAEAQMHSANALIGVATANRLPNVTIGFTNLGALALNLAGLFASNAQFWALAGIVTQPIFDGGTLLHRQRFAKALYEQSAAQYRLTILNAFQNVADTLEAIKADAITLNIANKAANASFKSLQIARRQLGLGDGTTLTILINEQLYLQAKLNLIQAQVNRLSDTVALFQALGGGWWNRPNPCKKGTVS